MDQNSLFVFECSLFVPSFSFFLQMFFFKCCTRISFLPKCVEDPDPDFASRKLLQAGVNISISHVSILKGV